MATALVVLAVAGFASAHVLAAPAAQAAARKTCSPGYVHAVIGGQEKCLKAGEFCAARYEKDYEKYGFTCVNGHLRTLGSGSTTTTTRTSPGGGPPALGRTVLLKRRTRTRGCKLGPLPDRRCSPGAYYSRLTKAVICSSSFHTGTIRNVPQSEKYAVEREYDLPARLYGHTLEVDHIVSLELGGSNNIANLFPEEAKFRNGAPGYSVKDRLENQTAAAVCAGRISLRSAQKQIAANWEKLYRKLFGTPPRG